MKKYLSFEVCDGDYNDVTTDNYKDALTAYRNAAIPKALFGITNDGVTIPIYSKV